MCNTALLAIFLSFGFFDTYARAEGRAFYAIEVENEGNEYQIMVNGAKVIGARRYVDPYLRHGENTIEILHRRLQGLWQVPASVRSGEDGLEQETVPTLKVWLVKERFFGSAMEKEKLLSYIAEPQELLSEEWKQHVSTVTLNLRGKGESYYWLEAWTRDCTIEMILNDRWSKVIADASYEGRIPFEALQPGENVLKVTTRAIASNPSLL